MGGPGMQQNLVKRKLHRVSRWFHLSLLFGTLMCVWDLILPGAIPAHPIMEQTPRAERMKAPGLHATPKSPLSFLPSKAYFPKIASPQAGPGHGIAESLLSFYRRVISPVDGNRCVMAPTCSLYGHQAIREHGVVMGMILTADRLLHEADEIGQVPTLVEHGEKLYVDPLEANTYWLWEWLK